MTAAERERRERWKEKQRRRLEECQQELERKTLTKDNAKARRAAKTPGSNRRKKKCMPGRKNTMSGRLKSKKPRTKPAKMEAALHKDRDRAFNAIAAAHKRTLHPGPALPLVPDAAVAARAEAKALTLAWLADRLDAFDAQGADWVEVLEQEAVALGQRLGIVH